MYKTKLRKSKIYKHLVFHFRNNSSVVPNPIVHYSDMRMVAIISNDKYKKRWHNIKFQSLLYMYKY